MSPSLPRSTINVHIRYCTSGIDLVQGEVSNVRLLDGLSPRPGASLTRSTGEIDQTEHLFMAKIRPSVDNRQRPVLSFGTTTLESFSPEYKNQKSFQNFVA